VAETYIFVQLFLGTSSEGLYLLGFNPVFKYICELVFAWSLSLTIDVASRAVAGFSISLESPSALSVSLVLSHAVLPKAGRRADRELQKLEWPMSRLPRVNSRRQRKGISF
jgi:hypothetical protein